MSDGAIVIDEQLWPLVRFTMRDGATEEDWLGLFDAYDRFYQRRERFAIINDSSHLSTVPSASTRRLIADLARKHEPMSERWVTCSCVIVTNTIVRGALTALTWVSRPVYPLHYVDSMTEAVRVSLRAFEDEGIVLDATLARRLAERQSGPPRGA